MISPARLIHLWLGLCLRSTRWHVRGSLASKNLLTQAHQGTVVAFWHRSLTLSPALWFWARHIEPDLKLKVLISRNADGKLIADAVRPWDIIGIHGSTARKGKNKGGVAVLKTAIKELKNGSLIAITPDGPRGPAEQIQPGAIALSRLTRSAIVPMGLHCSSWRLPTWDRLLFPLPFGRGTMVAGPPLYQPDEATLKQALDDVSRQAEEEFTQQKASLLKRIPNLLWALSGLLIAPALTILIRFRLKKGRELPGRLHERMGIDHAKRPQAPLLWVHAASVGESISAQPLITSLLEQNPNLYILFTTATVTGAEIIQKHPLFKKRIFHRFIPYDVPRWLNRFMRRWKPSGTVFIESEIWPGIITACSTRNIPIMVINGRLSDRSSRRWERANFLARNIFTKFTWVAARGPEDAARFRKLGTRQVYEFGDLKQDAPPLPYDQEEFHRLKELIGVRPIFVAASTHPGEEEIILDAAKIARQTKPNLLTILIPRHPIRGAELAKKFNLPQRSQKATPDNHTSVLLADTLGELGLFYRLADACFIGNSLTGKGGGHNPFEPLRLGTPTATGPLMDNWRESLILLKDQIHVISNVTDLANWMIQTHSKHSMSKLSDSVVPKLSSRIMETIKG
ncbi:glycosyltransferase N-terminal domain-containing protein [Swingsia samuiensis]|uniref:3-deoxy-D-manno-octulosonic acid transferase n=1 Tax=Swingsia samuiensis TaxID=1293412 RepID=A0A4Y6UKR0_9PROT|nr:glycosyltransferase N-terminal domain-containing protein [Swingsia samuiensis]QDH17654.1 DUF374 domain-containing protein [Swingsia samuiensis]